MRALAAPHPSFFSFPGLPTRFPVRRAGTIMEGCHEISSLYTAGWSAAAGEARAGGGVLLAALAR